MPDSRGSTTVNETLKQVYHLIRLFGLRTLLRRKKSHDRALTHIRGYLTTRILWTLAQEGFLDTLLREGVVHLRQYSRERRLEPELLSSLCGYLDALGLTEVDGEVCRPTERLKDLWDEPRGLFDLSFGYEPMLVALADLLAGRKQFGRDVTRRGDYVVRGESRLGRQLPYPAVHELLRQLGARKVLDLRCRDVEFLLTLCERLPVTCVGVENDPVFVAEAARRLQESPFTGRIKVARVDMFDVGALAELAPDADVLTARDAFHEHLSEGEGAIHDLLVQLRAHFPRSALVVAEFCLQSQERLRRRPTAFAEHHLFHQLTNQVILPAHRWRTLFGEAGYEIVIERVFDIVGHGYFALKPTG